MFTLRGILYQSSSKGVSPKRFECTVPDANGLVDNLLERVDVREGGKLSDSISLDDHMAIHTREGALRIHTVTDERGNIIYSPQLGIVTEYFGTIIHNLRCIVQQGGLPE